MPDAVLSIDIPHDAFVVVIGPHGLFTMKWTLVVAVESIIVLLLLSRRMPVLLMLSLFTVSAPVLSSVSRALNVPELAGTRETRNQSLPSSSEMSQRGFSGSSAAGPVRLWLSSRLNTSWLGFTEMRALTVRVPSTMALPAASPGTLTVFVASVGVTVEPETLHGPTDDGTAGTNCFEFPSS